jgi:hypothetical protein
MTYPVFNVGETLRAADMNAVGLWLVKTQAVVGSPTSVTITGAFSSDYDNYRIVYDGIVCSTSDTTIFVRPGADTSANYYSGGLFVLYTGTGAGYHINSGSTEGIGVGVTSSSTASGAFDVLAPNKAVQTRAMGQWTSDAYTGSYGGVHKVATAYTSIEIRPASGTFTGGSFRVYGYRN